MALRDRSRRLRSALDDPDRAPPAEVDDYVDGIGEYGERIESTVDRGTAVVGLLDTCAPRSVLFEHCPHDRHCSDKRRQAE